MSPAFSSILSLPSALPVGDMGCGRCCSLPELGGRVPQLQRAQCACLSLDLKAGPWGHLH